ncbi:uncharacterized protein LOC118743956 [Rhagoletis pomonella]|uniref:uncharacterized protein LOC118743956 n=1 Tax=Rhagoletis pomonella TaxID=28610 RepID=UPI0017818B12|nr:uncharacterized protein LOC118743956 [Rhagoletis pomonella]
MKFSCAIFFFVLTIAAQFQHIRTAVSDELVQFKQTLDEASDALQDVEESPALSGNAELQQQRRKSIDDLLHNSQLDLNLNLEREALDSENDFMHPLQGRDTKSNENKNNNDEMAKNTKVNDQLKELVRANSRFQNLHRQLLNSFHSSNSNVNTDDVLQRTKASKGSKSSSSSGTNSDSDKALTKEDRQKNVSKEEDSNNYSTLTKGSYNKNANFNKDSSFISNFDWKSNLGAKDNFNIDMDLGKDGSIGAPYSQTFSKFDSSDSANANSNLNNALKDTGHGSSVVTKAYFNCKPLASNAERTKSGDTYMEFTSDLREPQPNKESNAKSKLNTILLLEANTYRNSLNSKKEMDNLEELNEKKVDPEVHRMMQKVDFPHFKLDFDSSMEDFAKKSKSDSTDDDEPISYEKTIENIHFPSIVNDQFDLGRNDLSHEADYKLSKIEQEQSEPRKSHTSSGERSGDMPALDNKVKVPWKRSSGFNPMNEIKLKTSTRLMAKGLGPSLPSYALSETQQELQLDDAVKRLEKNFDVDSENEHNENSRHGSLVSQDILDWQERLRRLEDVEERAYEKLIYDNLPELSKEEKDEKSKTDDVIFSPAYTILRKRRLEQEPYEDDSSDLLDPMHNKRVIKNSCEDDQMLSQNLDTASPDDALAMQWPDLTPADNNKALADVVPAPEVSVPEIPIENQKDSVPVSSAADTSDSDIINKVASARVFDENLSQALEDPMAEKSKRCGERDDNFKTKETTDASDKDEGVGTISKFRREANSNGNANCGSKRRVKRIGVRNEAGEMTGIKEVDLDELLDLMTVQKLKPKREVNGKAKGGVEQEGKVESGNRDGQGDGSVIPGQKVLSRRRRELPLTKREDFSDDKLHVLNGCERMRRSVNKGRHFRRSREVRDAKGTAEDTEKERTNDETLKVIQSADEKDNANKSIQSQAPDAKNSEHPMGKRAAHNVDDIADNNSDNRKIIETRMLLADNRNFAPARASEELSTGQRDESPMRQGENYNEERRTIDPALFADYGNRMPVDQLAGPTASGRRESRLKSDDNQRATDTAFRRTEPLDDAAVIAADRRAMNAARAAYIRREGRNGANNKEPLEVDYRDLMARLRRLSLRNRERERERKREKERDFSNSVGEFGNQQFDNLKQVDQYAQNFDGIPVDNLWYGNDPWEEDGDNDSTDNDKNTNKNQPNKQRTALTIKMENGAIKSIERKEEPKGKEKDASVANEKAGSEEEEGNDNRESSPFGWFGKSKNKASNGKNAEDGMVLKLNDQVLNCTAFNTLEGFLKSVQQQNKEVSDRKTDESVNGAASGNATAKSHNGNCIDRQSVGDHKQGSGGQGTEQQGANGHRHGAHDGVGRGGGGNWPAHGGGERGGDGHSGKDHGGSSENEAGGQSANERQGAGHAGATHGDHGRFGGGSNGMGNDKKVCGGNSGDGGAGGASGSGPAATNFGPTSNDGNSSDNLSMETINMTVEIQPVTQRPMGAYGQKAMKLNITINASVMGDQKAKNFFGNGTFKVQSEERERRGISFPQFAPFKRYATKRKCTKPKVSCDEASMTGRGAVDVITSIFNMAKCNPQMKSLWASLKHNQQCMKKAPPQETGFEKMQKDDVNHIEDMVEQAMEAISDIIDDQVEQRSCIPLPPELKIFYEQILDVFESNSAEGVREKRGSLESPFEEFSKEVRLIDPNRVEQRSRIVKKLLREYDDLPAVEQQQMVGVRDDLLQNLGFLESIKEEQTQRKREQAQQQQVLEPQREAEPEQQRALPQQVQVPAMTDTEESESEMQARRQRELLKQLEEEKADDEEALKAYNLPYTPEFLRLLKASELMQEQDIREY